MAKEQIEIYRNLIANGKSERVIKELLDYFSSSKAEEERYSLLLQYSANIKQSKRKYNVGVLSDADFSVAQQKFTNSLLEFLSEWLEEIEAASKQPVKNNGIRINSANTAEASLSSEDTAGASPDDSFNVTTKNVVATVVPTTMTVGVDTECKVLIGASKELVSRSLSPEDAAEFDYDIELTQIVSVELKLKGTDQKAFQIVSENSHSEQALKMGRATEWTWMVNPQKEGSFTLLIFVSAVFRINGQDYPQDIKLEKKVKVTVNKTAIPIDDNEVLTAANSKLNILFLSANPDDTARLHTNEEFDEIVAQKTRSRYRDNMVLITPVLSASATEILFKILNEEPTILHFSGHGDENGIVLTDKNGSAQTLAKLTGLLAQGSNLRCVILNACYSQTQAEQIKKTLPNLHVIGMKYTVADDDARTFSTGFYMALGAGKTYEQAFNAAKALVGATTNEQGEEVLIWM